MPTVDYRDSLVELALSHGKPLERTDLESARTRAELGISSLDIIILMSGFMQRYGVADFRPEWVPMLESMDGICEVMEEIVGSAEVGK